MSPIHRYIQSSRITINMRKNRTIQSKCPSGEHIHIRRHRHDNIDNWQQQNATTTGQGSQVEKITFACPSAICRHLLHAYERMRCVYKRAPHATRVVSASSTSHSTSINTQRSTAGCWLCMPPPSPPHVENNVIYLHLQNAYAGPSMWTS